jgi:hypothetical protein
LRSRAHRGALARTALFAAALLGGCDQLGLGTPPPKAPPRLVFAQTTHDFGRVAQGVPVEHEFAFANDGEAVLSIIDLRAACDNQVTLLGGSDIAPHAGGSVHGRFDTAAVFGPQQRTITVYSNDPAQQAVLLTLSGEVVLDVAADPPQVYLGAVPPGLPVVREVALRTGSDAVRIGVPQADTPQLVLRLDPAPDASAAAILAIGTAPNAPPGPFKAEVRLPTTSARHPVVRVAVAGTIDAAAPPPRASGSVMPPDDAGADADGAVSVGP